MLEQVIDVPKITSQDGIPQRAVLCVPQMAEQLVDEPVHSFDDFELVEEEEEEEEQSRFVPESYRTSGRCWPRVVPGHRSGGGLLVDDRHEDARLRPIRLRTIRLRPAGRSRNCPKSKKKSWPKSKLDEVDRA